MDDGLNESKLRDSGFDWEEILMNYLKHVYLITGGDFFEINQLSSLFLSKKNNEIQPYSMDGVSQYLDQAFDDAIESVKNNHGGPFGAVIVRDGKIIGRGVNRVISENDPTAHAEVMAIRNACKNIGHFDLTGATIFTTCEPCPMCLSAIYWANIQEVYYCSTRKDAESIGFRDNHIYEELNLPVEERKIHFVKIGNPKSEALFKLWLDKVDKVSY